jgi:hypothetical protein
MAVCSSSSSFDTLTIRRAPATVHLPSRGTHGAIFHLSNRRYTMLTEETARLWAVLSSNEPTTARALTTHVSTEGLGMDPSEFVSEWLRRGLVVSTDEGEGQVASGA